MTSGDTGGGQYANDADPCWSSGLVQACAARQAGLVAMASRARWGTQKPQMAHRTPNRTGSEAQAVRCGEGVQLWASRQQAKEPRFGIGLLTVRIDHLLQPCFEHTRAHFLQACQVLSRRDGFLHRLGCRAVITHTAAILRIRTAIGAHPGFLAGHRLTQPDSSCPLRRHPKGLRHEYALHALSKNVPLNMVSKWMGHSKMEPTAIYANAVGEEQQSIAARM